MFINEKTRLDTIIVWGHGLVHLEGILDMIRSTEHFTVMRIIKHKPKNMKRFVNKVYSYDYAPLAHLKSKIKYLQKVDNCLICIVIKNHSPVVDILGEGSFRHKESLRLKELKTRIREKYNPYKNGEMSHDHVIHATDNEEQTYHILKALGNENIYNYFQNNLFSLPFFLGEIHGYNLIEVNMDELVCGQAVGDTFNYTIENVQISQSIQYSALLNNDGAKAYKQYIEKYRGTALKADYNLESYINLSSRFSYLAAGFENSYVTVRVNANKQYVIVDGLHRASIHYYQNNKTIKVCLIK